MTEAYATLTPYNYAKPYGPGSNTLLPAMVSPPAQAPVIQQTMPQATTLTMPSITAVATTLLPAPAQGLQPADLLHPLPSIVNTAPAVIQNPCDGFTRLVSGNPLIAAAALVGLAFALGIFKGEK